MIFFMSTRETTRSPSSRSVCVFLKYSVKEVNCTKSSNASNTVLFFVKSWKGKASPHILQSLEDSLEFSSHGERRTGLVYMQKEQTFFFFVSEIGIGGWVLGVMPHSLGSFFLRKREGTASPHVFYSIYFWSPAPQTWMGTQINYDHMDFSVMELYFFQRRRKSAHILSCLASWNVSHSVDVTAEAQRNMGFALFFFSQSPVWSPRQMLMSVYRLWFYFSRFGFLNRILHSYFAVVQRRTHVVLSSDIFFLGWDSTNLDPVGNSYWSYIYYSSVLEKHVQIAIAIFLSFPVSKSTHMNLMKSFLYKIFWCWNPQISTHVSQGLILLLYHPRLRRNSFQLSLFLFNSIAISKFSTPQLI